jgi:hypothetical protein
MFIMLWLSLVPSIDSMDVMSWPSWATIVDGDGDGSGDGNRQGDYRNWRRDYRFGSGIMREFQTGDITATGTTVYNVQRRGDVQAWPDAGAPEMCLSMNA